MALAGLLPLIKFFLADKNSQWPDDLAVIGFFGGAAILAAAPFRRATPISPVLDLSKIWRDKMIALSIAAISAALIVSLAQLATGTIAWHDLKTNQVFEPLLLLTILVCSTGFWTLLARSVIGGILLTAAAQFILYLLLVLFVTTLDRINPVPPGAIRFSHQPQVHAVLTLFIAGIGLICAGTMLWLGHRRFTTMVPLGRSSNVRLPSVT